MRHLLFVLSLAVFSLGTARAQTPRATPVSIPPVGLHPSAQQHANADAHLVDGLKPVSSTQAQRFQFPNLVAPARSESRLLRTEWSVQRWTDGDWENLNRNLFAYDETDRLTQQLTLDWVDDRWDNYSRQLSTYLDDAVSEKLTQRWFDAAWEDEYSEQFIYDSGGRLVETLFRRQTGSGLGDYARTLYTHGSDKTITLDQLWMGDDDWMDLYRSLSTYHAGNLVEFEFQTHSADGWTNHSRRLYTFDGNDLVEVVYQNWYEGAWQNLRREARTYDLSRAPSSSDEGRITEHLYQTWDLGAWQNGSLTSYFYDSAGRLDESLHQRWGVQEWYDDRREVYTYSGQALVETLLQDRVSNGWENSHRHIYAYAVTTASEESTPPLEFVLSVFPNPTQGNLNLSISIPSPSEVTVEVLDVLGRRVAALPTQRFDTGVHTLDWNLSSLTAGVYVIQLAGGATATRRFTVVR